MPKKLDTLSFYDHMRSDDTKRTTININEDSLDLHTRNRVESMLVSCNQTCNNLEGKFIKFYLGQTNVQIPQNNN